MINVNKVIILRQLRSIDENLLESMKGLLNIPPNQWPPILLDGKRLLDGLHRVELAKRNGITFIPFKQRSIK